MTSPITAATTTAGSLHLNSSIEAGDILGVVVQPGVSVVGEPGSRQPGPNQGQDLTSHGMHVCLRGHLVVELNKLRGFADFLFDSLLIMCKISLVDFLFFFDFIKQ